MVSLVCIALVAAVPVQALGDASFLRMFHRSRLTCGARGTATPPLLAGDKPVAACILRFRPGARRSAFGPMDF